MTTIPNNADYAIKAFTRSISNLDRRIRIVENREVPTGGGGPTPTGDAAFVHTQTTPAATWTVVHDLNKFPSITVVDSGGSIIIPDVHYDTSNQVTITFGSATSGRVFCN